MSIISYAIDIAGNFILLTSKNCKSLNLSRDNSVVIIKFIKIKK